MMPWFSTGGPCCLPSFSKPKLPHTFPTNREKVQSTLALIVPVPQKAFSPWLEQFSHILANLSHVSPPPILSHAHSCYFMETRDCNLETVLQGYILLH